MNSPVKYKDKLISLRYAVKIAKHIAKTYTPGRVVRSDEHYLMLELMSRHHRLKNCRKPVKAISVQVGLNSSCRTFCAHFGDGSYEFFGVASLLQTDRVRLRRWFSTAARREVCSQVKDFMAGAFNGKQTIECAITGKLLYRSQATCDHYPVGFRTILDDWLKLNNLDWQNIAVDKVDKNYQFADRKLAQSWRNYHRDHARYRVAEEAANTAQGNPSGVA